MNTTTDTTEANRLREEAADLVVRRRESPTDAFVCRQRESANAWQEADR